VPDRVQVTAQLPRELKKRAFIKLAEREQKFTPWLRQQLENLLEPLHQDREHNGCRERD